MTEYEFVGDLNAPIQRRQELSPWEALHNHREIVTGFVIDLAPPDARSLCVLGAGHCRDLNLTGLIRRFSGITLVDLRENDIRDGLQYQNVADSDALEVVGNLDVSGVHELLDRYASGPDDHALNTIIQTAADFTLNELKTYDCVASTCLLSQILCHATESVAGQHPLFGQLLPTLRQRHIEIMLTLLSSGGTGLLITDFVSSESLPELYQTTDLKRTLQSAIANENVLRGLNPATVGSVFNQERIKSQIQTLKITDPWRWVTPQRIYACFAIIFSKC